MTATSISLPVVIHAQSDCAKQLAERFLGDAVSTASKRLFSEGVLDEGRYNLAAIICKGHPAIIASLMQAQASSFQTLAIAEALREIRETINEHASELLGVAESAGLHVSGIERSLGLIVKAIRSLDRS